MRAQTKRDLKIAIGYWFIFLPGVFLVRAVIQSLVNEIQGDKILAAEIGSALVLILCFMVIVAVFKWVGLILEVIVAARHKEPKHFQRIVWL